MTLRSRVHPGARKSAFALALLASCTATTDTKLGLHLARASRRAVPSATAMTSDVVLRAGAFPGSGGADVEVHVPPGFDALRRPGVIVYFHGWRGCVAAALSDHDVPCSGGGPPRTASDLAAQLDAARVNALLVAVELRPDRATGEPGQLAMPAGLRALLREVFDERLAASIGRALDVDALDRVVLVAHSGGYQALVATLALGDVPRVTEVVLLDALYGGDDALRRWIVDEAPRFDPRASDPLRFVDLFTCCGGTSEASARLASDVRTAFAERGLQGVLGADVMTHTVVVAQVPEGHGAVPRVYFGSVAAAAGFAPTAPD